MGFTLKFFLKNNMVLASVEHLYKNHTTFGMIKNN